MFRPCLNSQAGLMALCAVTLLVSGCSLVGGSRGEKEPPVAASPAPAAETTEPPALETTALPDETTVPADTAALPAESAAPSDTSPPPDTAAQSTPVDPAAPAEAVASSEPAAAAPAITPPVSTAPVVPQEVAATKEGKKSKKKSKDKDVPAAPVIPPQAVQAFNDAVAQLNAGDLAQAEQAFRSLSTQYPLYAGPLLNLGILYAKTERFEEAEKSLREALRRSPANPVAFNELGIVYRRLGRFQDADLAYTQALRIDPNYALAHLNLGVLCDLYLQQPERALQAFERYLAITNVPSPQVTGWVSELKTRLSASQRSAEAKE